MRTAKIVIVSIVLMLSLGFNVVSYAYPWAFQRGVVAGQQAMSNAVMQQYIDTGQIRLKIDDKDVILVEGPIK